MSGVEKKEETERYRKAGEIASKAIDFAKSKLKPGAGLLDLARAIEEKIMESGGGAVAFPVNLSIDSAAAHDTPAPGDARVLQETDLLKVDIGVHVDGYIADTAFSYSADGGNRPLIEASKAALEAAVGTIRPGIRTAEVGKAISDAISSRGFVPVSNLCGHSLGRYTIHAGTEVPNVARGSYEFKEGDVFAIEPFASTGTGVVHEAAECQIFSLKASKPRLPQSRRLRDYVEKEFGKLPFATRNLSGAGLDANMLELALRDLVRHGALEAYPVLAEKKGVRISQAETTILVTGKGAESLVAAII